MEITANLFRRKKIDSNYDDSKNKKIPVELRKLKLTYKQHQSFLQKYYLRLQQDSQFFRSNVQLAFALLTIWIGIEFHFFVRWGVSGGKEFFVARPPGVDSFLPIGSFMSLSYWIQTGIINTVHPAGLFIFIGILATGILLKKTFCSWICPIGLLSESLWMTGKKIFGRNISFPRWIDIPLRSLKYMLLLFFVWSILAMDASALSAFLNSPYYRMADVKMYLFFAKISSTTFWTIFTLIALSVFVKNFWCRYFCPYGALLGLGSLLSPLKITRSSETCTDCELCTKVCPANIKVHKKSRVWSDECTGCLACSAVCPVKDTLEMKLKKSGRQIPTFILGLLVVGLFVGITGLAMLSGSWKNSISKEEYLQRFKEVETPLYQHFQGRVSQ